MLWLENGLPVMAGRCSSAQKALGLDGLQAVFLYLRRRVAEIEVCILSCYQ